MTFNEYYSSIRKYNNPLTLEEEQQLPLKFGDNKRAIMDELVLHNVGLVYMYVSKFRNWSEDDKIDALSLGISGLYKAAESFDFSMGVKFSSYAYNVIRTCVSRGMKRDNVDMNSIHIDTPIESKDSSEPVTLENFISSNVSPEYMVIKPASDKLDRFSIVDMCNNIKRYVSHTNKLTSKDKMIFDAYMSGEMLNLREIGERCGITHERVRQQQEKCFSIIREFIRRKYKTIDRRQLDLV